LPWLSLTGTVVHTYWLHVTVPEAVTYPYVLFTVPRRSTLTVRANGGNEGVDGCIGIRRFARSTLGSREVWFLCDPVRFNG
jgi:hypothetical protein